MLYNLTFMEDHARAPLFVSKPGPYGDPSKIPRTEEAICGPDGPLYSPDRDMAKLPAATIGGYICHSIAAHTAKGNGE